MESDVSDQAAAKGLIENLQRVDLNALERAKGYQRMVEDFGMNQEAIAKDLGLANTVSVSRHLALLQMPKEIQDFLPRGKIAEGHCRSIRQIPDETKQIELAQLADKEGWSVKATEKRIKQLLSGGTKVQGEVEKDKNGKVSQAETPIPDPWADLWTRIHAGQDLTIDVV